MKRLNHPLTSSRATNVFGFATAMVLAGFAGSAFALENLPTNEKLVLGSAQFDRATDKLTVTTSTDKTVINWKSFDIQRGHTVEFVQPGTDSYVVNQVVNGLKSHLYGSLVSNGHVIIANPAGVLALNGATIDVNGLLLSTLYVDPQKFQDTGKIVLGDTNGLKVAVQPELFVKGKGFTVHSNGKAETFSIEDLTGQAVISVDKGADGDNVLTARSISTVKELEDPDQPCITLPDGTRTCDAADIAAAEEAKRQAELEAQRKAEEEARLKAEEEARKKAEAEAEAKRQAEEEARLKAEAEAEAKRQAEEEARLKAEAARLEEQEKAAAAEAKARKNKRPLSVYENEIFLNVDETVVIAKDSSSSVRITAGKSPVSVAKVTAEGVITSVDSSFASLVKQVNSDGTNNDELSFDLEGNVVIGHVAEVEQEKAEAKAEALAIAKAKAQAKAKAVARAKARRAQEIAKAKAKEKAEKEARAKAEAKAKAEALAKAKVEEAKPVVAASTGADKAQEQAQAPVEPSKAFVNAEKVSIQEEKEAAQAAANSITEYTSVDTVVRPTNSQPVPRVIFRLRDKARKAREAEKKSSDGSETSSLEFDFSFNGVVFVTAYKA